MKHISLILFILFNVVLGQAQNFSVENYSVDIYVREAGYFDVVENYDVNFTRDQHGIFRTIQTEYDLINAKGEQEQRKIKISNIEVPGHKFDAPFDFVQKMSESISIKIGDKDKTIIGPEHYEIKYRVDNAFLYEEEYIRFYWNIKTDGWLAQFKKISFKIHLPEGISVDSETAFVYSGLRGSDTISQDIVVRYDNNVLIGESRPNYISRSGDNVTVLINLPLNAIAEIKPPWPLWEEYGWLFPLGLVISAFYFVFQKFGKDDKVVSATSYYPPEGVDPAMAGFLINDREDTADIISLIPHWGSQGLLKIEEIPKSGIFKSKDTKISRLKELKEGATEYEKTIYNGLFEANDSEISLRGMRSRVKDSVIGKLLGEDEVALEPGEVLISSLKNSFYTKMGTAKTKLKEKAQIYYEVKSKSVKAITMGVLLLLTIVLSLIGLFFWGPLAAVALGVTCIVLMIFNTHMIKRNAKGNRVLSELKGFKQFIKIAEENKLKMLLKEDPGYFESTMSYALAFGMFDRWANKFDAMNMPPPNWYHSVSSNNNMKDFSNAFAKSISHVQSNMVSSPSSSGSSSGGGGSSGGGFGGGGGGSW